ncbi:MAG: hypoxanthine phosphoribosyltransferase [Candidatus Falkowbacteria bacterium]
MHRNIKSILFPAKMIRKRIKTLGKEISRDYKGREPILIGVANGALVFLADLMRALSCPAKIDLIRVGSYGQKASTSGLISVAKDIEMDIAGKNVIVVEDIIDTGLTMDFIVRHLQKNNPASIGVCALLDKSAARKINIKINYAGFPVTNEFVVGYGLDYAENYRHLPYIGILKPEIYS